MTFIISRETGTIIHTALEVYRTRDGGGFLDWYNSLAETPQRNLMSWANLMHLPIYGALGLLDATVKMLGEHPPTETEDPYRRGV